MIIGNKIYYKKKVKSSLDWAKENITTASNGTIFLTDFIENAKGRGNRKWKCYEGQLTITILLKPNFLQNKNITLESQINYLTMLFSVAITKSLANFNIQIKWPNDFILNNKKLGGILTELIWENNKPIATIIGISLNINNSIPQNDELFEIATSLKNEFNVNIDNKELLNKIIEESNHLYNEWNKQNYELIFQQWKEKQFYLNKKIKIHKNDNTIIEGLVSNCQNNGDIEITNQKKEIISFYQVDNISIEPMEKK